MKRTVKYIVVAGCVLLALLLSGCVTKYDRSDIKEFLKSDIGLKKFKLANESYDLEGEDGYMDHIWEVEADGLSFYVIDDIHWGSETMANHLYCNYEDVLLAKFFENYQGDKGKLYLYTASYDEGYDIPVSRLRATVANREELDQTLADLEAFADYTIAEGFSGKPDMSVRIDFEVPNKDLLYANNLYAPGLAYWHTDFVNDGVWDVDENLAYDDFIYFTAMYGFRDLQEDFDKDYVDEYLMQEGAQLYANVDGEIIKLDGLAMSYGSVVYWGTLYEALVDLGYPVSGDKNHFQFTTLDGHTIEAGYSMITYDFEVDGDQNAPGYYFLEDGVKQITYYHNRDFSARDIYTYTGIYFARSTKDAENIPEDLVKAMDGDSGSDASSDGSSETGTRQASIPVIQVRVDFRKDEFLPVVSRPHTQVISMLPTILHFFEWLPNPGTFRQAMAGWAPNHLAFFRMASQPKVPPTSDGGVCSQPFGIFSNGFPTRGHSDKRWWDELILILFPYLKL